MSSAFSDMPSAPSKGPSGLAILAMMGAGMLLGIVFLAWLGTPRLKSALGQPITRVELTPLLHADKALSESDLQGKVTLLHFWGTWCPPCRQEFPEFAKIADALKSHSDIQVVSVSSSQGPEYDMDSLKQLTSEFLEQVSTPVPTYCDPAGLTRYQAGMLLPDGSLPYPSTFLIGKDGRVAGIWVGYKAGNMSVIEKETLQLAEQR